MLFNSYPFIFVFVPLTLLGYVLLGRLASGRVLIGWLTACSIVFYGLWNPVSLAILLPSIAINYALGRLLLAQRDKPLASWILALGVTFNVCFLGYFKYKNFFLDTVNTAFGFDFPLAATVLPLGISFITFQKIAFLFDVRSSVIKDFTAKDFLVFVFFFPQLIAGPIVHYREVVPQLQQLPTRLRAVDLAVGLCLFATGLFKKVVLADGIAPIVSSIFGVAEKGGTVGFVDAWLAALAFTLQIYFDFSGYSDMAIGLARLFGVRLPANFNSPLKATSVIEFWSRWHMTLTRFLMAYVYTPLVMKLMRARMAKRTGGARRVDDTPALFSALVVFPTMVTMGLSGLWHGAGFTFILWGLLHGSYLAVNHAWRRWRPKWSKDAYQRRMQPIGFLLTFTVVVFAMVLFRAKTLGAAGDLLASMLGSHGITLPAAVIDGLGSVGRWLHRAGIGVDAGSGSTLARSLMWILGAGVIALCLPNSLEVMRKFEPALDFKPRGTPGRLQVLLAAQLDLKWAGAFGVLFAFALLGLNRVTEFLYWQF